MEYCAFRFDVETYPIEPPLPQGDRFGGKVSRMLAPDGTTVNFPWHEHWGKTAGEASAEAAREAREWIDKHLKK